MLFTRKAERYAVVAPANASSSSRPSTSIPAANTGVFDPGRDRRLPYQMRSLPRHDSEHDEGDDLALPQGQRESHPRRVDAALRR